MDNHSKSDLEIIQTANQNMLDYFNDAFLSDLEEIQDLKTQAFEIEIKLDELNKTKDVYALKSGSKKSVFSPITTEGEENSRSKVIDDQINDLIDVRDLLNAKIVNLESSLNILKKRISVLNDAQDAINSLSLSYQKNASENDEDGFEFISDDTSSDKTTHGYNILMLNAFNDTYLSTIIERNIKEGIESTSHKLDVLSYLLGTDISKAKLTLKDIQYNIKRMLDSTEEIEEKLSNKFDSGKPVLTQLEDYIMSKRDAHPEYIIESNIEYTDQELTLHPVFSINLFRLLETFFDNIFKHSNANKIIFNLSVSSNVLNASISDNGIGIDGDYITTSPWYSNLHKAHEIIYLLNGDLSISKADDKGTTVKFKFPIQY
ncbi:MAG: hypothetical protein IJV15_06970 [Lachnospiraceae bacterium]|nr:hypothetical protein [Lachnospiraceae bacterium]